MGPHAQLGAWTDEQTKEKTNSGICLVGDRYYDPVSCTFLTRDERFGNAYSGGDDGSGVILTFQILSMIPVVGAPFNLAMAAYDFGEGDYVGGSLGVASAALDVVGIGVAVDALRIANLVQHASPLRFTQVSASPLFQDGGKFAGKTISDVADALKAGTLAPSDVPVQFIKMGGVRLIESTRSSLALRQAGIPETSWTLKRLRGRAMIEKILERLKENNLTLEGTETLRITRSGSNASTLRGRGTVVSR